MPIVNINEDLSGVQAKLVSGTNIKTINSTSLLGSGDIDVLQNGATGTDALAVGPTSSTATAYNHAVAVGDTCEANSDYSLALGSHAYVSQYSQGAIAIGLYAQISSQSRGYAIQLGRGSNAEANTFYVGLGQSSNYKLLGSDGIIPTDRLPFTATNVIITEVD